MNVKSITNSIYKSKFLKKNLELAANNAPLYAGGVSLVMSTFIRPLSILATPQTDKENKKLACAKSIASSAIGFGLLFCCTKPLARAISNIDKSPKKYLKTQTIKNLKEGLKPLHDSKIYQTTTQMLKLGFGFMLAAPKSFLVGSLTPKINNCIDNLSEKKKQRNSNLSFKGKAKFNPISIIIGKFIDKHQTQQLANKIKDTNYPMHVAAGTDILSTSAFIYQIKRAKDIKENRKDILCKNAMLSTGLCIAGGYTIDKVLEKPTKNFIARFSEVNKNSPKLSKYLEGIKIAKPTLILGTTYYAIIPAISTFFAERIGKNKNSSNLKQDKNYLASKI